ncbi:hypothetical protein D9M68_476800 [compost metagenome]
MAVLLSIAQLEGLNSLLTSFISNKFCFLTVMKYLELYRVAFTQVVHPGNDELITCFKSA